MNPETLLPAARRGLPRLRAAGLIALLAACTAMAQAVPDATAPLPHRSSTQSAPQPAPQPMPPDLPPHTAKARLQASAASTLQAAPPSSQAPATAAGRFEFVALGDMPYGPAETAYPVYRHLIHLINAQSPAFSLHVGDIKSGSSPCSDAEFHRQRDFFNQFDSALIYTPGDNEWTDCHRPAAGGHAPQERLETLREIFFAAPLSLGRRPLAVLRQSDLQPAHAAYRENLRFEHAGVLFLTLNVPGSNNGFEPRDLPAVQEFFARTEANMAWLQAAFARARGMQARAVVIAMQADPFLGANAWMEFPSHSGFTRLFEQGLLPLVQDWGGPVLLIHGDSHRFVIDRPFKAVKEPGKGQTLRNLLRLQVFGEQEVHAVRVSVDPDSPDPFGFRPLFNPLSPR